eukprot:sb/3474371/
MCIKGGANLIYRLCCTAAGPSAFTLSDAVLSPSRVAGRENGGAVSGQCSVTEGEPCQANALTEGAVCVTIRNRTADVHNTHSPALYSSLSLSHSISLSLPRLLMYFIARISIKKLDGFHINVCLLQVNKRNSLSPRVP